MIRLLLIADDFTGALDTGIQFAQYGANTKIITISDATDCFYRKNGVEVLVIDAETRHLTGEQAYNRVYRLAAEAITAGVTHIYKKTDSGLRGNIGSELKALLDASRQTFLPFIPAYPQMNRVTINGYHYVDGQPIQESVFGKDPFEPVVSSEVRQLFDSGTRIELLGRNEEYHTEFNEPTIGIFDAQSDEDIKNIAEYLNNKDQLRIIAGCAGFASFLPQLLKFRRRKSSAPQLNQTLLVMCGSVNPISMDQIEYAQMAGFRRIVLTPQQQLEVGYLSSSEGMEWMNQLENTFHNYPVVMLDTGVSEQNQVNTYIEENHMALNEARVRIASALGEIVKKLLDINRNHTLMIIGGDTLLGFFKQIRCDEIYPVTELETGTVLSYIKYKKKKVWIISKSGGFGKPDMIWQIAKKLNVIEGK
ncbi:MAG TPA: four-carbon acid sugar kinase family protein [Mobilitalea sp.]|nr:four-carbon acid sugar kinase family protein [Mobilitalea sp.]